MADPLPSPQCPLPGPLDAELLRLLMDTLPDRIYFKDRASRFVRINQAQARCLGVATPDEAIGRSDDDYFAPVHAQVARANEEEILNTGQPLVGKVERILKTDGTEEWGSTTKLPWRDASGRIIGTFGITRDVTTARQIEEKLLHERNLLRTIIDYLPSRIFVKDTDGRFLINNRAHQALLGVARQEEAIGHTLMDFQPDARGRQAAEDDRRVLSTGVPILNQERSDFGIAGPTRWALMTKLPLRDLRGKIIGLVGINHDITERKRVEQELRQRNDEVEADVRMARQIQDVFLPHTYPAFPRGAVAEASLLRFAHRYVPAASLGGDFFTVIQLSDTRCGLMVCDVMGHGVRAGLLTGLIRGLVEEMAVQAESPAAVLREINRGLAPILRATGQPVFASAFYGVIDVAAGTLIHANAGHPPAFLVRGGGRGAEALAGENPEPAAGLMEGFVYTERVVAFLPGDRLLAYSDGVFEASNRDGASFGEERLHSLICEHAALPAGRLVDLLIRAVQLFSGKTEFDDDICLLVAESTGLAADLSPPVWEI